MFKSSLVFLLASSGVSAYSFVQTNNARIAAGPTLARQSPAPQNAAGMVMYLGQSSKTDKKIDTTTIGTTTVPSIGVGTISWSSDSCKFSFMISSFDNQTKHTSHIQHTFFLSPHQ
jgi:hypothetical protein